MGKLTITGNDKVLTTIANENRLRVRKYGLEIDHTPDAKPKKEQPAAASKSGNEQKQEPKSSEAKPKKGKAQKGQSASGNKK